MNIVETYRSHNMWRNRMQGEEEDLSTHVIRTQAIAEGRTWALTRQADHIVRHPDGTIDSVTPYAQLAHH